jgi:nicotinamide mononucleotide transporter
MDRIQFGNLLIENVKAISWQEWISTFFQLISVRFAQKNNIWVYPTGIIGVALAAYLYLFVSHPPLYADGLLNVYFLGMSVYGWWCWSKKENAESVYIISNCNRNEWIVGIGFFLISWAVIQFVLTSFSNSNTPILDALVSSTAITAMWWMAKRKTENWLAWIASNLVAIPLNFYKGFILYGLMYIVFLFLAWQGFVSWNKKIKQQVHG